MSGGGGSGPAVVDGELRDGVGVGVGRIRLGMDMNKELKLL